MRSISRIKFPLAWLWLTAALTACQADGCLPSERVVVVYRGDSAIEVEAPVVREGKTVGVVAEVKAVEGAKRLVVVMKTAAALHRNDRYLPFRYERGVGLKVIPGTGEPLRDGDVVEAGLGWRPGKEPEADPAPGRAPETASEPSAPPSAPPQGEALPAWQSVEPGHDLRTARIHDLNSTHVPPALRRRPGEIAARARGQSPEQAVDYLTQEMLTVRAEYDTAMREARERGDRQAAAEIRALRLKTLGMLTRMRIQASQSR